MSQFHRDVLIGDNHIVHQFTYADSSARTSATVASTDIGKVSRQLDNDTFWILIDNSPLTWRRIDGGGGGTGVLTFFPPTTPIYSGSASEAETDGVLYFEFDNASKTEIVGLLPIPDSYVAGAQIKLKGAKAWTSVTSGNILIRAETRLIKDTVTDITALDAATPHNSTNAEITASGSANVIKALGDIDLTSASGQINAVSVSPGDILQIRLYRKIESETSSAAAVANLAKVSLHPDLGT